MATNPYLDPVDDETQAIIDQIAAQMGVSPRRFAMIDGELLFLDDTNQIQSLGGMQGGSLQLGANFSGRQAQSSRGSRTAALGRGGQRGRAGLVPALGQRRQAGGRQGVQGGIGRVGALADPTVDSKLGIGALGMIAPGVGQVASIGQSALGLANDLGYNFGVVGGLSRPQVGTEAFAQTVGLGRQAQERDRALSMPDAARSVIGGPAAGFGGVNSRAGPAGSNADTAGTSTSASRAAVDRARARLGRGRGGRGGGPSGGMGSRQGPIDKDRDTTRGPPSRGGGPRGGGSRGREGAGGGGNPHGGGY